MKLSIKASVAGLFIAATMSSMAMANSIRLGTEAANPPYNFIDDSGEISGFEREVGDELCKRASLTCEWVTNEPGTIIPNLVSGKYDAIITGMVITAERNKLIDFTQNYFPAAPSFYVTLGGSPFDVNDGVIAAKRASVHAAHIAASGATLLDFATLENAVQAVRNGQADAVLADSDVLMSIVSQSNSKLAVAGQVSVGGGVGMGIRKSDGGLKAKMNTAIASMKMDGSLNTLISKWFGIDAATF
ncbi:MAG: transporter substrate-binding domain-containing protein [Bacteroidetes bacterium]|nr:transporter substrate-binding domain-containing protein [Bacteroidota bacterium]